MPNKGVGCAMGWAHINMHPHSVPWQHQCGKACQSGLPTQVVAAPTENNFQVGMGPPCPVPMW